MATMTLGSNNTDYLKKTNTNTTTLQNAISAMVKTKTTPAIPIRSNVTTTKVTPTPYLAPVKVAPSAPIPTLSVSSMNKTTKGLSSIPSLSVSSMNATTRKLDAKPDEDTGDKGSPSGSTQTTNSNNSSQINAEYQAITNQLSEEYQLMMNQFEVQRKQLEESYGLGSQQYTLQLKQLQQDFDLATKQINEQQAEHDEANTTEAQSAYVAKMQSQRVAKNVLSQAGLANTGYENLYDAKVENTYKGNQKLIKANYATAMSAIQRAREAQSLAYGQNVENVGLNKAQYDLSFKQNLQNVGMDKSKYDLSYKQNMQNLAIDKAKAIQSQNASIAEQAKNETTNRVTLFNDVTQAITSGTKIGSVKTAVQSALDNEYISKQSADDIYRYAYDYLKNRSGR